MLKRSIAMLAAAFALISTCAVAESTTPAASQAVQLSDAQLDEITAGAFTAVILFTRSDHTVLKGDPFDPATRHITCINCDLLPPPTGDRPVGFVFVSNPKHPLGMFRCIGGGIAGIPC